MLPSKNRLKSHAEFRRVYGRGASVAGGHMVIYGLPGTEKRRRLGLSVSKKTGGAVVRNRIKRRLSDAFSREQTMLPEAYDAIIVARAPIAEQSFQNMELEMHRLLADLLLKKGRGARG